MVKNRIALFLAIALLPTIALAQSTYSSSSYKLKNLNFGQEIAVQSNDYVAPVISGDGPTASDIQADQATITWTTNKEGTSIISYGTTSGSTNTDYGKSSEYVTSHSVIVVGLTPETKYYYKAKSTDRLGNIGTSTEKNFTTTKKSSISSVTVSDITLTSAIISFETNTINNVVLSYGTSTSYGSTLKETSGSLTTTHTMKLIDLTQGTTYHFQIKGTDSASKVSYSDDYIFSTLPLPSITNVRFGESTANSLTIKWTTNTPTDSLVEYTMLSDVAVQGLKAGEKQSAGSSERVKEHSLILYNLVGATPYSYIVSGTDALGNQAAKVKGNFTTAKDNQPPKISKLKADTATASEDKSGKVQMTITWETDELSTSKVSYGKGKEGDGQDANTPESKVLTAAHFVTLAGLDPSSTYHVRALSEDTSGNLGASEPVTVLTPKKKRTLFQLISEKLEETFGWVTKLNIFRK